MEKINVGVIVGSLRKDSGSLKLAKYLDKIKSDNLNLNYIKISDLALYNEDLEANEPEAYKRYRSEINNNDALILITPEYNRSMSGSMKNAIDVGSRPFGANTFNNKPVLVISTSAGTLGGFGANHNVRQSLTVLNGLVMPSPEAYIAHITTLFDENNEITNESSKSFLTKTLSAFEVWVSKLA